MSLMWCRAVSFLDAISTAVYHCPQCAVVKNIKRGGRSRRKESGSVWFCHRLLDLTRAPSRVRSMHFRGRGTRCRSRSSKIWVHRAEARRLSHDKLTLCELGTCRVDNGVWTHDMHHCPALMAAFMAANQYCCWIVVESSRVDVTISKRKWLSARTITGLQSKRWTISPIIASYLSQRRYP